MLLVSPMSSDEVAAYRRKIFRAKRVSPSLCQEEDIIRCFLGGACDSVRANATRIYAGGGVNQVKNVISIYICCMNGRQEMNCAL